jgi:two-component system phosphate regulon sensor histidine kinase PhoR
MVRSASRLAVMGSVAVAAIAFLVGVFAVGRVDERARTEEARQLLSWARTVALLLQDAELGGESDELSVLARRARSASGLRVTLIAANGTVVADSDVPPAEMDRVANHASRPEVQAALAGQERVARRRSETIGRQLTYAAVPHAAGGVVRVAQSPDPAQGPWPLAWLALVVLTIVALWLIAQHVAGRPLAAIGSAARKIAVGDLSARTHWHTNDDLGEIAASIDGMARELDTRLRKLTEDTEQLQAVLGGMVEGVLVIDENDTIILANSHLREVLDVRGEPLGKRPIEALRNTAVEEILAEAAEAGKPVVREVRLGAGMPRVLRVHATSFASGPGTGVVAVFHDITEIRRVEYIRRDFVTNASHELKTPLTAIRGFAETLLAGELPEEDRRRYLTIIQNHAERLSRLVEDLLELSRAESSRLALEPRSVLLLPLARDVLMGMETRARERRIATSIAGSEELCARADARALEQILINLLENALKYTEPGGSVEIRVEAGPDDEKLRISVVDTGIGIPEADRARIFERFYRVDKARSRELGGTGLGLSIVRHLVQAMDGEVGVESTPGSGSTFWIHLPRARA